jgi:hypothetical protein
MSIRVVNADEVPLRLASRPPSERAKGELSGHQHASPLAAPRLPNIAAPQKFNIVYTR